MYDIKLFAKNEKELKKKLIQAVRIYSDDIGMGFGIGKWGILILKNGKRLMMEGIDTKSRKIRTLEKKKLTNAREYWKGTPSNKRR